MLNPAEQAYIECIVAELAEGLHLPQGADQDTKKVEAQKCQAKFLALLGSLHELAENQAKPDSIKAFGHILFASLQRDIAGVLKTAGLHDSSKKAEQIVSAYKNNFLHDVTRNVAA